MKGIIIFLQEFFQRNGQFIFFSMLISRLSSFLTGIFIVRLISQHDYGQITIVASLFALFSSLIGFGSSYSVLRYVPLEMQNDDKKELSVYLLRKGFNYQILLTILFLTISFFYVERYSHVVIIFVFFAVRLIGFYFLTHILADYRANEKNRTYAYLSLIISVTGLIGSISLTFFWGTFGYLISISILPYLSLLWIRKEKLQTWSIRKIPPKGVWNYALNAAATSLLSDLLFSTDIILLSIYSNETDIANYKVAVMIPFNITLLGISVIFASYPQIVKHYNNYWYLKNYVLNYYKIFVPISIFIFAIGSIFAEQIIKTVFGVEYVSTINVAVFTLYLFTFLLNILFRNLYGNMLSAVGKISVNTWVSIFSILILFVLSYFFVPKYGILGMAISMSVVLFCSGIILCTSFWNYLKSKVSIQ